MRAIGILFEEVRSQMSVATPQPILERLSGPDWTRIQRLLLRKVWLPRPLYTALPAIYFVLGTMAFLTAILVPHWSWVLPYVLLVGIACFHAAVLISALRLRYALRNRRRPASQTKASGL